MFLLRKTGVRKIELLSLLNLHKLGFYKTACQQNLSALNQITELKKEKRSCGLGKVEGLAGLDYF